MTTGYYALDNAWEQARQRLALLEANLDPASQRRLAALGVGKGWRCLEVGGGLGSVAHWLARQVGETGKVTVTDIDTRFLEDIQERNIEVWRHDILADKLPAGHFDLVHARWLLYHLPNPEQAVARMVAALRSGGWLVVEDVDFLPLNASTSPLYVDFMVALAATVGNGAGHDGFWAARTLPGLLAGSGLAELGGEGDFAILSGGTPMARFWKLTGKQMRDNILAAGALTAERYDAAIALLDDPSFRTFCSAGIAVWGRRPQVLSTYLKGGCDFSARTKGRLRAAQYSAAVSRWRLPFSSAGRLMGEFGTVVKPLVLAVLDAGDELLEKRLAVHLSRRGWTRISST